MNYILYTRKSSESEERQQLSIPAQLDEARKFAREHNLNIVEELTEKKSAKTPGRPVFNQLLSMIKSGQANGILSWHPDRLARNALDAGRLFYLLDQSKLKDLKFPSFNFTNDPNGRFMLSIAFGQSQYFSDALSVNTKRGLIAKCKMGWRPGKAPFGYRNAIKNGTKVVLPAPQEAKLVKQVFEKYAAGSRSLLDIQSFLTKNGAIKMRTTNKNNKINFNAVRRILTDPFYYGAFYYAENYWEGKHQPIISKELFERVQAVLNSKSPTRKHNSKINFQKHRFPFTSFINCSKCGYHITAEQHTKHYRTTGKSQTFVYYTCHSRKSGKLPSCDLPYIRERELLKLMPSTLKQLSLTKREYRLMQNRMAADKEKIQRDRKRFEIALRLQIDEINGKLNQLVDLHLDGELDKQLYQQKRRQLISQRRTIEEQLDGSSTSVDRLFEPLERFLKNAYQRNILAAQLTEKLAAEEITPSDFTAVPQYVVAQAKEKRGIKFPKSLKLPNSSSPNSNLSNPNYPNRGKLPSDHQNQVAEVSENRRFLLRLDQHLRQMQSQDSNLTLSGRFLRFRGQNEWAALSRRPRTRSLERDRGVEPLFPPWKGGVEPIN